METKTKFCLLARQHLRDYTAEYTPISLKIPKYDDYLSMISKSALYDYRKAIKNGYTFEKIHIVPHDEIINIYKSWDIKQDRKINLTYCDINFSNVSIEKKWYYDKYEEDCSNHNLEMYVVKKDTKIVAFAEVLNCDNIVLIHATMSHKEHVANGVMKYLFIEIARRKEGCRLLYGTTNNLKDERVHFVKDLCITEPFTYTVREDKQIVVLDFDDLEIGKPGLEELIQIKEHIPNLKVTFFMVPIAKNVVNNNISLNDYKEWAKFINKQDWIEIAIHGVAHNHFEMRYINGHDGKLVDYEYANLMIKAAEHTLDQLDIKYKKIWKSPHWETSKYAYQALWDNGYTVAVDPNQIIHRGGLVYTYNWSINDPFPDYSLVRGHGHLFPPSANAVQYCYENMLSIPQDVEYKFISEILL